MYRCRCRNSIFLVIGLLMITGLYSCYKKDIQFGNDMAESHTRLITIDTVTPVMSTYLLDSFATSGASLAMIGLYKDAYLGNTTASTYLQFGLPALSEDVSTLIPSHARFDSLVLYMKPAGYYYGDTTKPFSISVQELAAQLDYTYASQIYNTSSVNLKPGVLGTYSKRISPTRRDTVVIKLPYDRGLDFYDKIRTKASEFQSETNFLNYFKGVCIQPGGSNDGAIYNFNVGDSSIKLRLYYHVTVPYFEQKELDFTLTRTSYLFNRIITDRTGTSLEATTPKQREFFASTQYPYAFTQDGTGALLKVTFPSLRELLKIDDVVRLLDAKLILKPVIGTFDDYKYPLPNALYMAQTDATNAIGTPLADTTGETIQYRSANIDRLYGENTQYTFSVTSYINALLNTEGTSEHGVFILQEPPGTCKQINRGVFGSRQNTQYQTKLVLTLMTIE